MKKFIGMVVAALLVAAPALAQVPSISYTAQAGVSLFSSVSATATSVSGAVRLPSFSGAGVLTITESGITGSPSGCTVALKYQGNNASTPGAVVSTTSFTPSTGVQTFVVTPNVPAGDNYVATYACGTYPTAGTLTASFSPVQTVSADPCLTSPKQSVSLAITTATTTQVVALSSGKTVYVCGLTASFGATTTAQLEYGTGTTCGTGTTALSGTYAPATGGVLDLGGTGTKVAAPTSNALCIVSTGTGGINGFLTYVQQ